MINVKLYLGSFIAALVLVKPDESFHEPENSPFKESLKSYLPSQAGLAQAMLDQDDLNHNVSNKNISDVQKIRLALSASTVPMFLEANKFNLPINISLPIILEDDAKHLKSDEDFKKFVDELNIAKEDLQRAVLVYKNIEDKPNLTNSIRMCACKNIVIETVTDQGNLGKLLLFTRSGYNMTTNSFWQTKAKQVSYMDYHNGNRVSIDLSFLPDSTDTTNGKHKVLLIL